MIWSFSFVSSLSNSYSEIVLRASPMYIEYDIISTGILPSTIKVGSIHLTKYSSSKVHQEVGMGTLSSTYTLIIKGI